MTDAQRQIEQFAAHARKRRIVLAGYKPICGLPRHPDGSLRLCPIYAAKAAVEPAQETSVTPVVRGARGWGKPADQRQRALL